MPPRSPRYFRSIVLDPNVRAPSGFAAPRGQPEVVDPNGILDSVSYNARTGTVSVTVADGGADAGQLEDAAYLLWPLVDVFGALVDGAAVNSQQPQVLLEHVSGVDGSGVQVGAGVADSLLPGSFNAVIAMLTYNSLSQRGVQQGTLAAGTQTLAAADVAPTTLLSGVFGHPNLFSDTGGSGRFRFDDFVGEGVFDGLPTGVHRSRTVSGLGLQFAAGQWYLVLSVYRASVLASPAAFEWKIGALVAPKKSGLAVDAGTETPVREVRVYQPVNPGGLLTDPPERAVDGTGQGITLTYVGEGEWDLFIPGGTGPHAGPGDGVTYLWPMRSWVTGETFSWKRDESGEHEYLGSMAFEMESITDPQTAGIKGSDVYVGIGVHDGDAFATAVSAVGGILYANPVAIRGVRTVNSVVSVNDDASPSDALEVTRWLGDPTVSTDAIIFGNSGLVGTSRDLETNGPNFDNAIVAGFIGPQDYIALTVYCPTATVGDKTIRIRPHAWCTLHNRDDTGQQNARQSVDAFRTLKNADVLLSESTVNDVTWSLDDATGEITLTFPTSGDTDPDDGIVLVFDAYDVFGRLLGEIQGGSSHTAALERLAGHLGLQTKDGAFPTAGNGVHVGIGVSFGPTDTNRRMSGYGLSYASPDPAAYHARSLPGWTETVGTADADLTGAVASGMFGFYNFIPQAMGIGRDGLPLGVFANPGITGQGALTGRPKIIIFGKRTGASAGSESVTITPSYKLVKVPALIPGSTS